MRRITPKELPFNATLSVMSAVIWIGFWWLNAWLFEPFHYVTGISFIYFPAGIRLGLVLVCGVWGALGIALGNPLLFANEFGSQSLIDIGINSIIAGFVPLFTVAAVCRSLGVRRNLINLRPIHLPIIALAVSVTTPLAFNLQFLFSGLQSIHDLWQNLFAMILGDFLGCMLALIVLKSYLWAYAQLHDDQQ